jgi:CPA1 family monovalent cation:H+ antiporter
MTDLFPLLALLLIGIGLVVVAERLRFPYPVALVLLGFGLGIFLEAFALNGLKDAAASLFTPRFFFDVLLPPIIFEAAIHVDFRLLRARLGLIVLLVFGGVLFTTIFTGLLVGYLTALPLTAALLLAATLSPTDPIAVVEMFRRLRVPSELSTIVESESLFNDAVGVILFLVLLGVAESGTLSLGAAALQFTWLVVGGILIGLLAAGGVYLIHRRLNDASVETALTVVVAYGAFLLATDLGTSGITATAIAGIVMGTWIAPRAMTSEVREAIASFWRVVVFIVNALVFLSIGLLFTLTNLETYLPLILLVTALLFAGRAIFVYLARAATERRAPAPERLPSSWYGTIALAGVRGAIPVVLALSLLETTTQLGPSTIRTVLSVVIGVAVLSIVINNLFAEWYVSRRFGPEGAVEV